MSLFALLLLLAQDGLPPADEPSAMACTFETALRGKAECASSAKKPELPKSGERGIAEASLSPKCALKTRLNDSQGRLTPEAAACIDALRVLSRALFDGAAP